MADRDTALITLDEILVADPPQAWRSAGFTVDDDTCRIGTVRIRLVGREAGSGIVGWSLRGLPADHPGTLDGVTTTRSVTDPGTGATHPNGVVEIDHVVLLSPDLARTTAALGAVGVLPRRERDGELGGTAVRQVFFRFGPVVVEVVGSPDATSDDPSSLWGLTHVVADIDAAAVLLGDATSPVKDAVQPGRRITTLRHRDLGMSVRTALISPVVR
ncbi:MAG: hypothetical protein ACJ72D_02315 [Marmoricola sp.]